MSVDHETSIEIQMDETDVNLRAYLESLSAEHLGKHNPNWTDDEVKEWDGNFRSDGALMLVCCERDVEIEEFRKVSEEHLRSIGSADKG